MIKNYFILLLLSLFSFNHLYAEACPEGATTLLSGSKIVFSYPPATSFCVNRPITIIVNGTSTYTLDQVSCDETVSVYNLTSGPAITGQDFTVTSGFDTECIYSNGTLPVDEYTILNNNLKLYPNPLTSGNTLKIVFGSPITAKLSIYNVTGKIVLSNEINNQVKKEINTNTLANGIYMLKISTDNATTTRKVVIMK